MTVLLVNGQKIVVDVEPDTPLLWAIRENLGLSRTKYGCGIGACGACKVLIDGAAVRRPSAAWTRASSLTRPPGAR